MDNVIYNIVDPQDNKVIYVGKTGNIEQREKQHLSGSHNTKLRKCIKRIIKSGRLPVFNILQNCQITDFSKAEKYWIKHFQDEGFELCNKRVGIKEKLMEASIKGQPATQKNVTLLDAKIKIIEDAGKLAYMSFSAYVNKLIDADLQQSSTQP